MGGTKLAEQGQIVATHAVNFSYIINMDKLFSKENISGLRMVYGTNDENEILKRIMQEQESKIQQVLNRNIFVPIGATCERYDSYVERQKKIMEQMNMGQEQSVQGNQETADSSNIDIKDETRDNKEEHFVLSDQESELLNNIAQSIFELSSKGILIEKIMVSDKLSHEAVLNLSNQYRKPIVKGKLALNEFKIIEKENTEAE